VAVHVQYVTRVYARSAPEADGFGYVVMAFVCFGNAYPVSVLEWPGPYRRFSLLGKPLVPGHDAHVAFVKRYGAVGCVHYYPAPPAEWTALAAHHELFSEVMLPDSSQALPIAILRVRIAPS
jgi:hypothetical protein